MDTRFNSHKQQMDVSYDSSEGLEIYEPAISQAGKILWAPVISNKEESYIDLDKFRLCKSKASLSKEKPLGKPSDNKPSGDSPVDLFKILSQMNKQNE